MKLEDIKKMSNEEFIEFARNFQNFKEDIPVEEFFKQNKKIINIMTIMPGITFGMIPYSILDNFTDDNLILSSSFILGTIIGIPTIKKLVKWLAIKASNESDFINKNELIDLKKDLEKLSEEELAFLIGIDNNKHIYKLNDRIKGIFGDDDSKKFVDSLEVTYEDDEKNLGYPKNIGKNN